MRGSGRGTAIARTVLLAGLAIGSLATTTAPGSPASGADEVAALSVEQRPITGELPADGDLEPGDPLPVLRFDPTRLGPLDAVHEVVVRNTGTVELRDVVITDDRLGVLPLLDPDLVLPPGRQLTVRASESFVFADAAGRLPALLPRTSVVTAVAPDDTEVTGSATSAFEMVAVLEPIELAVDVMVVPGSGDLGVGVDGGPELLWSAEARAAGAARRATVQVTVRNVGGGEVGQLRLTATTDGVDLLSLDPDLVLAPDAVHEASFDVVVPADALDDIDVGTAGSATAAIAVEATATDTTGLVEGSVVAATELRLRVTAPVLPAAGPTALVATGLAGLLLLGLGASVLARPAAGRRRR